MDRNDTCAHRNTLLIFPIRNVLENNIVRFLYEFREQRRRVQPNPRTLGVSASPVRRKGSLKALASELDLSITTVSRALAGYSDVAATTRQRVTDAAARINYVPNSAGKMLVTGRSGYVGLTLPLLDDPFSDPFLGNFIAGLGESLAARDYDLLINTVAPSQTEMQVLRRTVESGRVDGIVLTRISETDERVDFLRERQIPFVTHGRTLENHSLYSWIDTDGEYAFTEATDLLLSLGHRKLALLSITEPMMFRHVRENGVAEAITNSDVSQHVSLTVKHSNRFDLNAYRHVIKDLLNDDNRPTALLVLTDEIALLVLEVASELGLSVPEHLSVIGFGNIPQAAVAPPGLTTFDQSTRSTASQIGEVLLNSIDGKTVTQQQLIRPFLVSRGSHGPAPVSETTGVTV